MIYDNIQRLVCYEGDTANVFTITNVNDLFLLIIILFIYHSRINMKSKQQRFFFRKQQQTKQPFFFIEFINLIKEVCWLWCASVLVCQN